MVIDTVLETDKLIIFKLNKEMIHKVNMDVDLEYTVHIDKKLCKTTWFDGVTNRYRYDTKDDVISKFKLKEWIKV